MASLRPARATYFFSFASFQHTQIWIHLSQFSFPQYNHTGSFRARNPLSSSPCLTHLQKHPMHRGMDHSSDIMLLLDCSCLSKGSERGNNTRENESITVSVFVMEKLKAGLTQIQFDGLADRKFNQQHKHLHKVNVVNVTSLTGLWNAFWKFDFRRCIHGIYEAWDRHIS